jgi:hypothetical protein
MSVGRSNFASVAVGEKIIVSTSLTKFVRRKKPFYFCKKIPIAFQVCGGYHTPSPVDSVECYDVPTNTWTILASLNLPRSALSIAFIPQMNLAYPDFGDPKQKHNTEN